MTITGQALGPAGTITAQMANRGYELNPRSGMISLDLPPGMISPVPGGVSDHHVTVVYLGKDVDDEAFAVACERAQAAAASVPGPLNGMVGGIGTFPPSGGSDGKVPVWARVVLPGAELLRSALEDLSASEHKHWAPHVTLAYADPGDPLPPPVPSMQVSFSHLSVHRGDDEVIRYPIGGGPGAELAVPKGSARPSRAGGTITGQMDLGWDGWRAESRDSHGRWSRSEATAVAGGAAGRVEHDRSLVSDARTASPEEFSRAFEGAFAGSPFRAFVNHYTPQQMRDEHMTPVLAAGGKAGVLVHPHGDGRIEPTALFNTSGRKGMGLALLRMAIEKHGANYVECFGPALNKMYGTLGFKDGDVYPFDPGEAPADWDRAKFDSPDYHTMNLAAQRQKVIAAASEDEGLDLGEVRRQANCTEDEWEAALAVFGIASPSAGSSKTAGHPGA